jgi:protease IV
MNFLKTFLASCLGSLVALALITLFFFAILGSLSSETEVIVDDNSVLHLKLDKPIAELELEDPLAELLPGTVNESMGLIQLKEVINQAKEDTRIKGIYLNASYVMTGFATLEEIRQALVDFRSSGKWVVAYADYYSEGAYYLASAADKVYMNPEGQVEFNGLSVEVNFFKKLFDKLDIKPQIFRVGDFKSAVEPFMREDLSAENRLQLNEMLNSIHGSMLTGVSASRGIEREQLSEIANKMLIRNSGQALERKLIDSLFYDDQVKEELRRRLGLAEGKKVNFVKYSDYKRGVSSASSSKNEIAVIVADGEILPGRAGQGVVGSATIREEIRKARTNERVKAIVIRVNSPGGVFQAADEMWREVYLASKEKPVIASMGDYAASGGYYLAMACDTIVAQPTTITGSIGVFSVLFDLSSFLDDRLGITSDQVNTGEVGDMITVTRPLTSIEKDIWQKQTDEIYETFTRKAAEGRGMDQADIKKVASGRVWTGEQAKERNLVDIIGTFDNAVQIAAEKAGVLTDYKIRYYPKQKNFLERIMNDYGDNVRSGVVKDELGEYATWLQKWNRIKNYQGTQARMPFEFSIQ